MTSSSRPHRFWMVKGFGPSSHRHVTLEAAEGEARRLARENPGRDFYVLEAIACHRKIDVERVELRGADDDEELPF